MWPSYNFCVTLFFLKLFHVTFIWPSCDFCKTLVCYDSKASQSPVIWPRGFYFLSFFSRINRFWPVTKKNISKARDALKAEDTHIAFHPRMENSVCTLFFNASLFCAQRKASALSSSEVSSSSASGGKDTYYVHLEGIWQSNQYAP